MEPVPKSEQNEGNSNGSKTVICSGCFILISIIIQVDLLDTEAKNHQSIQIFAGVDTDKIVLTNWQIRLLCYRPN
jgi:hypothetical protein